MDKIKIYPPLYKRIDMIKYIYTHNLGMDFWMDGMHNTTYIDIFTIN